MFINPKDKIELAVEEVFNHPPKKSDAPVRLPGACFDSCDQACVDEPFHANCPGYCDLK